MHLRGNNSAGVELILCHPDREICKAGRNEYLVSELVGNTLDIVRCSPLLASFSRRQGDDYERSSEYCELVKWYVAALIGTSLALQSLKNRLTYGSGTCCCQQMQLVVVLLSEGLPSSWYAPALHFRIVNLKVLRTELPQD